MGKRVSKIDERHRKELMGFLLVKTAAVRQGVKPAELLRVRHCYETVNEEGLRICLYRSDIYETLGLDYLELKVEKKSSLVIFYNRAVLAETLGEVRNRRWLSRLGYREGATMDEQLAELKRRAAGNELPHEVGLFVGYPLKDVAGFMSHIPSTPVHHISWRVYGGAEESIACQRRYSEAEVAAKKVLEDTERIEDFIQRISLKRAS